MEAKNSFVKGQLKTNSNFEGTRSFYFMRALNISLVMMGFSLGGDRRVATRQTQPDPKLTGLGLS